jgi:succinate dehydrogenase / fumarate reductase iron-sulfur subunit
LKYLITIKRQNNPDSESYIQKFEVEVYGHVSVATMLKDLNEQQNADISWECGCMSRKCGACAMRINGKPMLACACFADEIRGRKITIEPLSKFPVVRDLIVDRTAIFEGLKDMELYLSSEAFNNNYTRKIRYMSAKCLMCGCCLEVCPNFNVNHIFIGAVGSVNAYRILSQEQNMEHKDQLNVKYKERFYEGCGNSLSCHDICPAGIEVDELTARSNAVAVWKR